MRLELFKTFWGFDGGPHEAAPLVRAAGFDGIEAQVPPDDAARDRFGLALERHSLAYIAEITTAGSYVPDRRATPAQHLHDLDMKLARVSPLPVRFCTVIAGCDAWPLGVQIDFFSRALELAARHGVTCSFETHRSRSLFNPWVTRDVVRAVPDLLLTCDFSHWVVVCERLLDDEGEALAEIVPHAHHLHGRVGYPQGPQVPHPGAPEYADCLASHQRLWESVWRSQRERGYRTTTMTPEFGPDGYLHTLPFTNAPVADLWTLNAWIGHEERRHFASFSGHGSRSS